MPEKQLRKRALLVQLHLSRRWHLERTKHLSPPWHLERPKQERQQEQQGAMGHRKPEAQPKWQLWIKLKMLLSMP
ncbi:hypothetical protein D3C78_1576510 [compost metagenome]